MRTKLLMVVQYGAIGLAAGLVFVLVRYSWTPPAPAHALPEFAARTGEPCATCHVSPGGGGPRTLRGMLWAARGRPDQVPQLPGVLIAPGVTDGPELFDIACSACHGAKGEGLFGTALAGTALREGKIRSAIERGRERSGMPAFAGQFTEAQLDALVSYVAGLANGTTAPPPDTYPLEPGIPSCSANPALVTCGGN
ncbi:MAG: cytochrome c [Chloroflexi bacterium]|nr:MAG: cytochrome c [Chloroflexota bacterium]